MRGDLSNKNFIDSFNDHDGRLGRFNGNSLRNSENDRMRKSDEHLQFSAGNLRPETGPDNLQLFREPVGHSLHHIVQKSSGQPMQTFGPLIVAVSLHDHLGAGLINGDSFGNSVRKFSLGPFYMDLIVPKFHPDLRGNCNGNLADS